MNLKQTFFLLSLGTLTSSATITAISTSNPVTTDAFSDGVRDYFGVVTSTAPFQIGGTAFDPTETVPVLGAIAGRDHDDALSRPKEVSAVWSLGLPTSAASGTGLTNISFSATTAANTAGWDNFAGDTGFIRFELLINGAVTETLNFLPSGTPETALNQLTLDGTPGGLALVSTPTGPNISITNPGGAAVSNIVLRGTFNADNGSSEHWTFGTLSAEYDQIPEPSSLALLGLSALGLVTKRSRL